MSLWEKVINYWNNYTKSVWSKLSLSWGVVPVMCESLTSTDVLFYSATKLTKEFFKLNKNDQVVITGGLTNGQSGNTDLIKVATI